MKTFVMALFVILLTSIPVKAFYVGEVKVKDVEINVEGDCKSLEVSGTYVLENDGREEVEITMVNLPKGSEISIDGRLVEWPVKLAPGEEAVINYRTYAIPERVGKLCSFHLNYNLMIDNDYVATPTNVEFYVRLPKASSILFYSYGKVEKNSIIWVEKTPPIFDYHIRWTETGISVNVQKAVDEESYNVGDIMNVSVYVRNVGNVKVRGKLKDKYVAEFFTPISPGFKLVGGKSTKIDMYIWEREVELDPKEEVSYEFKIKINKLIGNEVILLPATFETDSLVFSSGKVEVRVTKCGDGICGAGENYLTCPQDCPSGGEDNYCDGVRDGICDPDCMENEDVDCAKGRGKFVLILILIVVVVLLFVLYKRTRIS